MESDVRVKLLGSSAVLLLLALLAGCASTPGTEPRMSFVEFTPEQKADLARTAGRSYRIQEGDVLRVAFPYEKELTQEGVVVLNDGAVSLVGVDRVRLAGLTLVEADSLVTEAYAKDYVEPDLSIMVMETNGRRVYVLGEVKQPGLQKLPYGGVGLLGAITLAGGFTEDAAKAGTVLIRVTENGYLVQEIDLSHLNSPEYAAIATIELEPYDVVYVPRSRMGDFGYFTRTVLQGLAYMTRIASDVKYLSTGLYGRY